MQMEGMEHVWLDFQEMASFRQRPMVVTEAKGVTVRTREGREYIDAIAGAIVSTVGYGNERMQAAIREAAAGLDFWPVLHSTTEAAVELSARLADLLPGDLDAVFLLSGGSEATETAMKMARQYHRNRGDHGRWKIVSRWGSYHGATRGALAASGVRDRRVYEPHPAGYVHVEPPSCYRCPFNLTPETCDIECAQAVEQSIRSEGASTVAAIIADPIMMASGVFVPPRRYYERLREIADATGALLIFDEVATGFGRTGHLFAADYYGVVPDIICLGKGLSGGYAPAAATVTRTAVADEFVGDEGRKFLHGHTFGGHPLVARIALAAIDELERQQLVDAARGVERHLRDQLTALAEMHPEIGDVRGVGVLWGIEFVADRDTRDRFPRDIPFAAWVREHMLEHGVITRGSNSVLILCPALVISTDELDRVVAALDEGIVAARERVAAA